MSLVTLLHTMTPPAFLSHFETLSLCTLKDTIAKWKPSSSPLDVMPARLLKEVFNSVGPMILSIVNSSLSTGCVFSGLKLAVVHPLFKKPSLNPLDFSNFRPISKLPFFLKNFRPSSVAHLTCGVPQGPTFGPCCSVLPLGDKHTIQYHCYADDTQIFVPLKASEEGNFCKLLSCLSESKCWRSQSPSSFY